MLKLEDLHREAEQLRLITATCDDPIGVLRTAGKIMTFAGRADALLAICKVRAVVAGHLGRGDELAAALQDAQQVERFIAQEVANRDRAAGSGGN